MDATTQQRVERTNFDGEWSDKCPYCEQDQLSHRTTTGPVDGVIYEHRMPCEPERALITRQYRQRVIATKSFIFLGWILTPFALLLLQQFVSVVGWIAFGIGIFKLTITTIKHFGNPDKWIPGYTAKQERELRDRHYIYHCERNPEGFARLRSENFARDYQDDDE
jgi:hypothetical protein